MGRSIRRAPGKFLQLWGYANDRVAERQLSAELMKLVKIKPACARTLHAQRLDQHLRGDEGIAVAIPADPTPNPQE